MKFERFNFKALKPWLYLLVEILVSLYLISWLGMKASISAFVGFIIGFLIAMIYHDLIKSVVEYLGNITKVTNDGKDKNKNKTKS